MRFRRTSVPRHPSGCSGCACIRWDCQFGRSSQYSNYSVLTVLTSQSGTGRTNYQRPRATRRRRRRRGSRSTRNRSRSTARKSGCTPRSTQNRSYCSKSTSTAAAGLTPRRSREQSSRAAHQKRKAFLRTAFLHRLTEKHDIDDTEFLVDAGGYLTALARHELGGQLNTATETTSKSGFRPSQCGLTAFTPSGGAVRGEEDEKTLKNAEEAQTRGAPVVAVCPEGHRAVDVADAHLEIPDTDSDLAGLLANVQLQLVSYYAADLLERPIDKPRNLAKSVTVE